MEIFRLSKENLIEWKIKLNFLARFSLGENFSECLSDEEWLEMYEGKTAQEVVLEEI